MDWANAVGLESGPIYMRIADAIERAVRNGTLVVGERLPSQRTLAKALCIDLTTVTRAFLEARKRSLVDPRGHAGSYISPPKSRHESAADPKMISPPSAGLDLADLLRRGAGAVLARTDASTLMSYQRAGGNAADLLAATKWLEPMLGKVDEGRIVVTAGAQMALSMLLVKCTKAREVVLTDDLTYPGFIRAATSLDRRLHGVETDDLGIVPSSLSQVIDATGARLLYLNPTAQNPTGSTIDDTRRAELCALAKKRDLLIVEDDPCWRLSAHVPSPLAARIPEQVAYISTLSKCISPTLQTAFLVLPAALQRRDAVEALSGLTSMGSPFMAALATQLILDGSADAAVNSVRSVALHRALLVKSILPDRYLAGCNGLHAWLCPPTQAMSLKIREQARLAGFCPQGAEMFCSNPTGTELGVRLSISAAADETTLRRALRDFNASVWGSKQTT